MVVLLPMGSLPLGFRFHPTDVELINHYLRGKIDGRKPQVEVIPEIDVCKCEPWDLPEKSLIKTGDPEWFFFAPRDRKYPTGHRSNRATEKGYWKATGKDRTIKSRSGPGAATLVGMKKTLVFYLGRAPKGERTHWIMHEYRAVDGEAEGAAGDQGPYVLCRLFRKTDEKSAASNCDDQDEIELSPTPTKSALDNSNHLKDQEEVSGTTTNEELVRNVKEEELWSIVEGHDEEFQQPKDSNSKISFGVGDFEANNTEGNELENALRPFRESFCDSSEPYEVPKLDLGFPFSDRQMFGEPSRQNLQPTDDYSEQHVMDFSESVLIDQDEHSTEENNDQHVSAANVPAEMVGPTYNVNAIFPGSNCELDAGLELQGLAEGNNYLQPVTTLDCRDLSQNIGACHHDREAGLNCSRHESSFFIPDLHTTWQELYDSLEESCATIYSSASSDGISGTGIVIRSPHPSPSSYTQHNEGSACRRVHLQTKIQVPLSLSTNPEPSLNDDMHSVASTEMVECTDQGVTRLEEFLDSVDADELGTLGGDETRISNITAFRFEEIRYSADHTTLTNDISGDLEESVNKSELRSRKSKHDTKDESRGSLHKPRDNKSPTAIVYLLVGFMLVMFLIAAFGLSKHS